MYLEDHQVIDRFTLKGEACGKHLSSTRRDLLYEQYEKCNIHVFVVQVYKNHRREMLAHALAECIRNKIKLPNM